MNLLVDAQVLIWAVESPEKLPKATAAALQDPANNIWISAGTVWEICIKVALGKLQLNQPLSEWMGASIQGLSAQVLPIKLEHAIKQADLEFHHRDPFDRLLVSQALIEEFTVVSADQLLDKYGIHRLYYH